MRLLRGSMVLFAILAVGCAHKKPPPTKNPEPSPAPKGDLLRFKASAGDSPKGMVKLTIEQEQAAKNGEKSGSRKVILNFTFSDEEKVDAVAPDGTAQVSSRLVDVVGTAGQGAAQPQVDDFALALDELKVQFRRSPRGDVSSITLTGVRNPLDDRTARTILNLVYAGGRGPILPDGFVDVGATWNNTEQVPTPFGGSAQATYVYKYVFKDGGVATLDCDGTLDSQKGGANTQKRLAGKNQSEFKFNIASGKLTALTTDQTTMIEDVIEGQKTAAVGAKAHFQVSWTAANQ